MASYHHCSRRFWVLSGDLDFTAKGGKRQGRAVPRSLKTTRFGKPN